MTALPACAQAKRATPSLTDTDTDTGDARRPFASIFHSTIISTYAGDSCADVSANNYLSLGFLPCDAAPAQDFVFHSVGTKSNKVYITSAESGLCLQDYRSEVREGACSRAAIHRPYELWTLRPVDAARREYQIVQTLAGGSEQCMNATATNASPPYVLWLDACLQGDAVQASGAQTFRLAAVAP